MNNIVGQVPRGVNFYPRHKVLERIYRRLDAGNHLYLAAPRRSGKTSIMHALADAPREGYIFIYLDVEDCNDEENYFMSLANVLEASVAQGKLAKLGAAAKSIFEGFFDRIKKIKIAGWEVETNVPQSPTLTYKAAFGQLLGELKTDGAAIVIMVDEFPVAVERISKKTGADSAVQFLLSNRTMRQSAGTHIRFIYTGSIGLPNVARQLRATAAINDLNIVEIPPLSQEDALDMSRQIFATYNLDVAEAILQHMLDQIQWLIPFFVQLMIQLLIDESESEKEPITEEMIEKVLSKAANHRNNVYFASYYDRLDKTLPEEQRDTAKQILGAIAQRSEALRSDFHQANAATVIETLEYDGYINDQHDRLRFNSPILRMWWAKNALPT